MCFMSCNSLLILCVSRGVCSGMKRRHININRTYLKHSWALLMSIWCEPWPINETGKKMRMAMGFGPIHSLAVIKESSKFMTISLGSFYQIFLNFNQGAIK